MEQEEELSTLMTLAQELISNISEERNTSLPRVPQLGKEGLWGPKRDPLYIVVPITVFYSAILVSGIVGNVSTCVVIARNRHMHTATNYYLFSLAVSDLLLLVIGLPPEMYSIWSRYPYIFGERFCFLTGLAAETCTNATVLTITAFTVERYVAICHPFLSHQVSKLSRAVKFVFIIWFISLVFAVPLAVQFGIVYEVNHQGKVISEEYRICSIKRYIAYVFEVSTTVFFLVPMMVITILYVRIALKLYTSNVVVSRRRCENRPGNTRDTRNTSHGKSTRRVVNMLMAVVAAFFLCWAPFQAQRLYAIHADSSSSSETIFGFKVIYYLSGILYYFSATVNPILYNIMSLKFREAFKSTLKYCLRRKQPKRCEPGGSSGGPPLGNGSLHISRFNYSVLSRRSYRAANSCSSGASLVEGGGAREGCRRPLVVSFKRRGGKTTTTSLEESPDKHPDLAKLQPSSHSDPVQLRPPPPKRVPRIEDIEIFQESQLRIQRRAEVVGSVIMEPRTPTFGLHHQETVKKSHTVPCLATDNHV